MIKLISLSLLNTFMYNQWYPQNKNELNKILDEYMSEKPKLKASKIEEIHGIIVPHAGYEFSGAITGKAFSLLKNKKINKAVILGPSHYVGFHGLMVLEKIETPLGKIKIIGNYEGFETLKKLEYEHSLNNQITFLQKINSKIEVLPLVVGEILETDAEEIAKKLLENKDTLFIFSTDLSHFLSYEQAIKTDKQTIKIIENLDFKRTGEIDACGRFPLMIMMHLCKLKNWRPKLIEYKNSGDVTGDKSSVVGYGNFVF